MVGGLSVPNYYFSLFYFLIFYNIGYTEGLLKNEILATFITYDIQFDEHFLKSDCRRIYCLCEVMYAPDQNLLL